MKIFLLAVIAAIIAGTMMTKCNRQQLPGITIPNGIHLRGDAEKSFIPFVDEEKSYTMISTEYHGNDTIKVIRVFRADTVVAKWANGCWEKGDCETAVINMIEQLQGMSDKMVEQSREFYQGEFRQISLREKHF